MKTSDDSGSISLVAILAFALFVELWLNRIFARLVRNDVTHALARGWQRLDLVALFSYELVTVLGTVLLIGGLGRLVLSSRQRPPLRLSLALVGGVTAVLCAVAAVTRLPQRLVAHLLMSVVFLMVLLAIATLAQPTSRRLRAGVAILVVPLGLMIAARLFQSFSGTNVIDPRASMLWDGAGMLLVIVGLVAPLLFPLDRPHEPAGPWALALALLVGSTGLLLGKLDGDLATRLAYVGLGISLPVVPFAWPVYVLGAAGFAYAIGALVARPGIERLRGVGLFLVCIIGLQLELPYQLAGSLVGLLCLFESATRAPSGAITRAELDEHLRRWAGLLGAAQVTVVGAPGRERARMAFAVGDVPALLVVERRASVVHLFELSVGEIPERAPSVSLAARHARRLGPAAPGSSVATGDDAFDTRYAVSDHRGAGTALLDPATRARIVRVADGWIGVWPQTGARFRGRALPVGDDGLPSLAQLLVDLRARSGA